MPKHEWFLTLSEGIANALNALYLPTLQAFIEEQGLEGMDLWIAQSALSAEPEPMTAVIILERAPYINEKRVQEQMAQSAARGVLTAVAPHTYTLTPQGRHFAQTVPNIVYKAYQAIDNIIPPETYRLVDLLNNLVSASLAVPEPISKAALQRSRFYDPGPQGHILDRLRRALNDLTAFRDDVHLASWSCYGVTGIAWEAFSHIHGRFTYDDPVTTATELAQKLEYRGYDAAAYQQALIPIVARGWLTEADGVYRLTEKGEHVRQTAESETDRLFYAPWSHTEAQLTEIKGLMEKVNQALQPPALATIWQLAFAIRHEISHHYMPALHTAIAEAALPPLGLFLLMQAQVVSPASLTADHILPIIPYMAETAVHTRLAALVEAGFLTTEHHLTPKGQKIITRLTQLVKSEVAALTAPTNIVRQTAAHLTQLVQNSVTTAPLNKPAFAHAHFHTATPQDPPLFHLLRAIAQLAAFRDDAHVAAWQSLAISGQQWETFSHVIGSNIWGEPIITASEATAKFAFRGHEATAYEAALQDCVRRGWLVERMKTAVTLLPPSAKPSGNK